MSESVIGKIKNFIYQAEDSLYKVVKIITDDDDEMTVVGYFPLLSEELRYEFFGEYIEHQKFGTQFKVSTFKRLDIDSKEGIISFLSSDLFKGIGEKTATKIYEVLGKNCLELIEKDYTILNLVQIPEKKQKQIYDALMENKSNEETYVELYNYGLTANMIKKLYDNYGNETISKIKSNPYRLIYEVDGYGFTKSDNLALTIGFSIHDELRIREGLLYTLNYVCNTNGFVFLTDVQLINSAQNLLNKGITEELIAVETIERCISNLIEDNRLIKEENRIYIRYLYENEINFSKKICLIKNNTANTKIYDQNKLNTYLDEIEKAYEINYTYSQKEAIFNSINSNISIITGGPGTGKTTIIKGILNMLACLQKTKIDEDDFQNQLLLVAPTGRAAKRLSESTNIQASTIHKALGYNYNLEFTYNEDNLLSAKTIIIDEASMIDINLAYNFFKAIPNSCKVIIVGDEFQLPSIGPGNVLHDLIASNTIKVSRLNEVMRQAMDSDIIKLSIDIKNQNVNFNNFREKKEVMYYDCDSSMVVEKIELFTKNFIEKGGNLITDLQILIPMYSGVAGIDNINKVIQEKFNPNEKMIVRGTKLFKVNDKVLQLKNDPILNIMNGDIGYIKDIVKDEDNEYLIIDFDGLMVNYNPTNFENLTLAYAISIHKSQGSEYKNVIMPIVPSYFTMLKRKLIYTAVTRAKQKLIIIGKYTSFIQGITTNDDFRQTSLTRRLLDKKPIIDNTIYINDPEIPFRTLGEENMENITPYVFMK